MWAQRRHEPNASSTPYLCASGCPHHRTQNAGEWPGGIVVAPQPHAPADGAQAGDWDGDLEGRRIGARLRTEKRKEAQLKGNPCVVRGS